MWATTRGVLMSVTDSIVEQVDLDCESIFKMANKLRAALKQRFPKRRRDRARGRGMTQAIISCPLD
jgi:hypothetical protein